MLFCFSEVLILTFTHGVLESSDVSTLEVYKHCFFKLENSEKSVVFSMDATFDSDFLNIFTSFHIFTRGKRKLEPF